MELHALRTDVSSWALQEHVSPKGGPVRPVTRAMLNIGMGVFILSMPGKGAEVYEWKPSRDWWTSELLLAALYDFTGYTVTHVHPDPQDHEDEH